MSTDYASVLGAISSRSNSDRNQDFWSHGAKVQEGGSASNTHINTRMHTGQMTMNGNN